MTRVWIETAQVNQKVSWILTSLTIRYNFLCGLRDRGKFEPCMRLKMSRSYVKNWNWASNSVWNENSRALSFAWPQSQRVTLCQLGLSFEKEQLMTLEHRGLPLYWDNCRSSGDTVEMLFISCNRDSSPCISLVTRQRTSVRWFCNMSRTTPDLS